MHMLLWTQVVYSILPMSFLHLVSKYGHYEGAVTGGLCGKWMTDREGQERRASCFCHHPDQGRLWKGPSVQRSGATSLTLAFLFIWFRCQQLSFIFSHFFPWLCSLSSLSVPRRPGVWSEPSSGQGWKTECYNIIQYVPCFTYCISLYLHITVNKCIWLFSPSAL